MQLGFVGTEFISKWGPYGLNDATAAPFIIEFSYFADDENRTPDSLAAFNQDIFELHSYGVVFVCSCRPRLFGLLPDTRPLGGRLQPCPVTAEEP